MKNKTFKTLCASVCGLLGFAAPVAFGQQSGSTLPLAPTGWLDAYPTMVQAGTHPTIRWGINHPMEVTDVITIRTGDTVVASEELLAIECRVLGNGVTVRSSSGTVSSVPVELAISFDGGSFSRAFYGVARDVKPDTIVWQRSDVKTNQTVRFRGRYYFNSSWGPTFRSGDGTNNVRILTNGDVPPAVVPAHNAPSLEDFLKPYLGPDGRVKIGPMDFIVFMELTHTRTSDSGYDLQDLVLICTVKPKTISK